MCDGTFARVFTFLVHGHLLFSLWGDLQKAARSANFFGSAACFGRHAPSLDFFLSEASHKFKLDLLIVAIS
jgi:hypothetical protein